MADFRDGLAIITAMKISSAVKARLMGYAVMIVANVLCDGNTANIQKTLTPQTPMTVRRAGTSDLPNPRRYPDMFSYSILNVYAENMITSLVYPISIT